MDEQQSQSPDYLVIYGSLCRDALRLTQEISDAWEGENAAALGSALRELQTILKRLDTAIENRRAE